MIPEPDIKRSGPTTNSADPHRATPSQSHPLDDEFVIDNRVRNYQTLLKPILLQVASQKWSHHAILTPRVLDVVQGALTWIVGTIYMDMPLKPQVLQDLAADIDLKHAVPPQSWRDPRLDVVQLEDESGRIRIIGSRLLTDTICTGIVVAVLGTETSNGDFEVIDVVYPSTTSLTQSSRGLSQETRPQINDEYIVAISGLQLHGQIVPSLSYHMLRRALSGQLSERLGHVSISSISTLVIVGDSITYTAPVVNDAMSRKLNKNRKYGYDAALYNARPAAELDRILEELCQTLNVIIVPGQADSTNLTLPQQPLNKLMFPRAARFLGSTLRTTTNPTYLQLGSRTVFCTAGQTIDDIGHYINHDEPDDLQMPDVGTEDVTFPDPLDIMEETLKWRHAAPTAPDTLWTYPFSDKDPFIFTALPNIYLLGNQAAFAERLVDCHTDEQKRTDSGPHQMCRLIALPRFSVTGELVMINTRTLDTDVIRLECP